MKYYSYEDRLRAYFVTGLIVIFFLACTLAFIFCASELALKVSYDWQDAHLCPPPALQSLTHSP